MRKPLILCLVALAFATGVSAAEHGAPKAEAPVGQYVDIATVALPVVYERKLVNYVFVSMRLNLANGVNVIAMREKEPYFRDALVKAAHRRPFTRLDDFTQLDEAAMKSVMSAEAARIAGPRVVTSVGINHQTPKTRGGLPKPPQAKAAGVRPAAPVRH